MGAEVTDSVVSFSGEDSLPSAVSTDSQRTSDTNPIVDSVNPPPVLTESLPSSSAAALQKVPSKSLSPDDDNTQSFANLTYDTMPPPRARVKQNTLNRVSDLQPLQLITHDGTRYVAPYGSSPYINPFKQQDPDPKILGRPDPRYICIVDPDPEGVHTPPTPTWKAVSNRISSQPFNEAATRKLEAITSYIAPPIYKINMLPNTTHISAGELPVHFNYFRHSGGTIKCDECKSRGRAEVYKCHHCVAQICNECIDKEIANEISMDDYQFTWKGTRLHGAFKLAYLMRKNTGDAERPFEGWITFSIPSTGAKYRVYVSIDVVPRAQKKPKSNNKRTRQIAEVEVENDKDEVEDPIEEAAISKKPRHAILEPESSKSLFSTTSTPISTLTSTSIPTTTPTPAPDLAAFIVPIPAHPPIQYQRITLQPMMDSTSLPTDIPPMAAVLIQLPGETIPRQMPIVSLVCRDTLDKNKDRDKVVCLYERIRRD